MRRLPFLDVAHPKLLIVFSAGNGVGKTSLSKRIQRDLQALVLENDAIKTCLLQWNSGISREDLNTLTWRYSMDLYARLGELTPNGLLVRDGVIDWYYERILPIFEQQGYSVFIVGYDVSRGKRIELLQKRGNKATTSLERMLTIFDEHEVHIARFREQHTPDIMLTDDNLFDYDRVITALKDRLQQLAGE